MSNHVSDKASALHTGNFGATQATVLSVRTQSAETSGTKAWVWVVIGCGTVLCACAAVAGFFLYQRHKKSVSGESNVNKSASAAVPQSGSNNAVKSDGIVHNPQVGGVTSISV